MEAWSAYFFWTTLGIPAVLGVGTTVWFTWGSVLDIRRLFRDLETRTRDALDNGMVSGYVSLADEAAFAAKAAASTAEKAVSLADEAAFAAKAAASTAEKAVSPADEAAFAAKEKDR